MDTIRLSVVLSGGAALGAYQSGAMAALVVAVEHLRDADPGRVRLEAVGGASAGALVGMIAATGHVTGLDPVDTLHTAWVEQTDLDLLLDRGGAAPLGAEELRTQLASFLTDAAPVRTPSATEPVAVQVALSGLRGLTYHVGGLRGPASVPASTYADWTRAALEPGLDRAGLFTDDGTGIGDAALASAANPGVFPPRLLDRSPDRGHYEANGIEDLPDHGRLWFTDGGIMQTTPLTNVLSAARDLHTEDGGRRLALLVDPRSEGPSTGRRFADPDHEPTWLGALARTLSILPAQVLYDDLRRVERDNDRVALVDRLADALTGAVADDPEALAAVRAALAERAGTDGLPDDPADLVRHALATSAGVAGRAAVDVDVLTPLLLVEDGEEGIESLLAGELLGDMGGFLDRELRHSDFVLGYATTLRWLEDALPLLDVPAALAEGTLAAVRAAHEHDWRASNAGRAGVGDLPASARAGLVRLAASALVSLGAEALGGVDVDDRLGRARDVVRDAAARLGALLPGTR